MLVAYQLTLVLSSLIFKKVPDRHLGGRGERQFIQQAFINLFDPEGQLCILTNEMTLALHGLEFLSIRGGMAFWFSQLPSAPMFAPLIFVRSS